MQIDQPIEATTITLEPPPDPAEADPSWPADIPFPPTDLPYDDGDKMESPWHFKLATLLIACYVAARGGRRDDYYIGANMFVYYSAQQVRNRDYRGPDLFIVKNVDGSRYRHSWIVWEEHGRYPDVIFELLSASTEAADLGAKKDLYEQTFHTAEYFCVAPEVARLLGWRLEKDAYAPIGPDERGWLWSEQLDLWIGPWHGKFLDETHTWLRFYHPDGSLVLLPEEAERERAEAERERAEELAARLAVMEAELARLRSQ
jgi:Uma2 family endonuclease